MLLPVKIVLVQLNHTVIYTTKYVVLPLKKRDTIHRLSLLLESVLIPCCTHSSHHPFIPFSREKWVRKGNNTFCDGFNFIFSFLGINKKYENAYQNLFLCHVIVIHSIIASKQFLFFLLSHKRFVKQPRCQKLYPGVVLDRLPHFHTKLCFLIVCDKIPVVGISI